ncbi:14 kDa phosphohistidine phosphatase isoform X1 [Saccopteryx bilineata]|uniref:14 kDa phosphohistidine phosphatase isoform X1 n=1 Tax=Saccopteryx bilineata TaxID=59482 RepID=UPI00338E47A0
MPPRDWSQLPRARLLHCRRSGGWRCGEGCVRATGAGVIRETWRQRTSPRSSMWISTPTASSTDIYDKVSGEMQKKGYDCECLGGGRISHQSQDKKIHVYGYSMGYGRAQHSVSTEKIKARYPDYEVTWADDGY